MTLLKKKRKLDSFCNTAHIGLAKTGSTFLQRNIFPKFNKNYFSIDLKFFFPNNFDYIKKTNYFWLQDLKFNYFLNISERRAYFKKQTNKHYLNWSLEAKKFSSDYKISDSYFISAEGFCGFSKETCEISMRLLKKAGIKKIIFIVRKQTDYAKSLWRYFLLNEDRFSRYVSFEDLFGNSASDGIIELNWNIYIDKMTKIFGKKKILILPYELFVKSPDQFLLLIKKFLGLSSLNIKIDYLKKINVSKKNTFYRTFIFENTYPLNQLPKIRRRIKKILYKYKKYIPNKFFLKKKLDVDKKLIDEIQNKYSKDNKILEKKLKIRISSFGYY